MSFSEPNAVLKLYRFKAAQQAAHGIGICSTRAIACSTLSHAVLATTWVEISHAQNTKYRCQLYATWYRDTETWDTPYLQPIWTNIYRCNTPCIGCGLRILRERLDRIVIEKNCVYLRDLKMITNERHIPYMEYWMHFPKPS